MNAAAQDFDRLTVTQWVRPAVPGEFKARLIVPEEAGSMRAVENVIVTLRGREGLYHQGRTNEGGEVVIPDVAPGVYSMTARRNGLAACYAMHILGPDQVGGDLYPETIEIPLAPIDYERFRETIRPHLPSDYEIDSLDIIPEHVEKIVGHTRGNELFQVQRSAAGGLVGYIYQSTDHGVAIDPEDIDDRLDPAEATHVFLFKTTKRIRRDLTSRTGRFEFEDLEPGIYSLAAVGRDGVAVLGFELSDPLAHSDASMSVKAGYRFVNLQMEAENKFAVQVTPMTDPQIGTDTQENAELPVAVGDGAPIGAIAGAGGAAGAAGAAGAGAIGPAAALGGAAAAAGGGSGGFSGAQPASDDTVGP